MPTFTTQAQRIARTLLKMKAFDKARGIPLNAGATRSAAKLVNAAIAEKGTKKPKGGSQHTVYWLTDIGLEFARGLDKRKCRFCGCTEMNACKTPDGPCHWVLEDVCSNPPCVRKACRELPGGFRRRLSHAATNKTARAAIDKIRKTTIGKGMNKAQLAHFATNPVDGGSMIRFKPSARNSGPTIIKVGNHPPIVCAERLQAGDTVLVDFVKGTAKKLKKKPARISRRALK